MLLLLRRPTTTDQPPTASREACITYATRDTRHAVFVLMAGTFAIGALFAVLPLLSGSTLATRWLMFSLWAVAVGAALSLDLLWRRGRAGRLLALAIGGYVLWLTASMWLMALAWRVRPPEPF
jgi:hypothetical protein